MPTISLAYLNNSSLNYSSTTSVTLATSFRTLIKLDHSIYLKLTIIILIILVILLVIFFVIKCDKQKQTSQIPFEKFQLSTHSSISLEDDACDCNNVSQYIKAFSNDLIYNESDKIIYHYTDIKSAKAILNAQVIYASQSIVAEFGKGVFLTTMPPVETDQKIVENNYLVMSDKHIPKTKCAFAFQKNDLANLQKINDIHGRNVWKTEGDICLKGCHFELVFRK